MPSERQPEQARDTDIPAEHRGNHVLHILHLQHAALGDALLATSGTIGRCADLPQVLSTFGGMPGMRCTHVLTLNGISTQAAQLLEEQVPQIHARLGLTRHACLQMLNAPKQ